MWFDEKHTPLEQILSSISAESREDRKHDCWRLRAASFIHGKQLSKKVMYK